MSVISLRIELYDQRVSKVFQLKLDQTIREIIASIQQKTLEGNVETYGLFQPQSSNWGDQHGRWLKHDKTLLFYELKNGEHIQYRRQKRDIQFELPDGTTTKHPIDESMLVSEIVLYLGEKLKFANAEEFGLIVEGHDKKDWLNPEVTLTEYNLEPETSLILRRRLYFYDYIPEDDATLVHFLYCQLKADVVSGELETQQSEAVELAALQCQIEYDKDLPNPLKLKEILPATYRKSKNITQSIVAEHKKFTALTALKAKSRYFQLCQTLSNYGQTSFAVKERKFETVRTGVYVAFIPTTTDKEIKTVLTSKILAISKSDIYVYQPNSKKLLKQWSLAHLRRWAPVDNGITLDFGDYEREFFHYVTLEAESISQLLHGYIQLHLKKKTSKDEDEFTATAAYAGDFKSISPEGETVEESHHIASIEVTDYLSFQQALLELIDELSQPIPAQFTKKLNKEAVISEIVVNVRKFQQGVIDMMTQASFNPNGAISQLESVHQTTVVLVKKAKQGVSIHEEGQLLLNIITRSLLAVYNCLLTADALASVPTSAPTPRAGAPTPRTEDPLKDRMDTAIIEFRASTTALAGFCAKQIADNASSRLCLELTAAYAQALDQLAVHRRQSGGSGNVVAEKSLRGVEESSRRVSSLGFLVSPTVTDNASCDLLSKVVDDAMTNAKGFFGATPAEITQAVTDTKELINLSFKTLGAKANEAAGYLQEDTKNCQRVLEVLRNSQGNPALILSTGRTVVSSVTKLLKGATVFQKITDKQKDLSTKIGTSISTINKLVEELPKSSVEAAEDPNNRKLFEKVLGIVDKLNGSINELSSNCLAASVGYNLRMVSKLTIAATLGIIRRLRAGSNIKEQKGKIQQEIQRASEAIKELATGIVNLNLETRPPKTISELNPLINTARKTVITISSFLEFCAKLRSPDDSEDSWKEATTSASRVLRGLLAACRITTEASGGKDFEYALEAISAANADFDAILLDLNASFIEGSPISCSKEEAIELLENSLKEIASRLREISDLSSKISADLGMVAKGLGIRVAEFAWASKFFGTLILNSSEKQTFFRSCKLIPTEILAILNLARVLSNDPTETTKQAQLKKTVETLPGTISKVVSACRAVVTPAQGWIAIGEDVMKEFRKLSDPPVALSDDPNFSHHEVSIKSNGKAIIAGISQLPGLVKAKTQPSSPNARSLGVALVSSALRLVIAVSTAATLSQTHAKDAILGLKKAGQAIYDSLLAAANGTPTQVETQTRLAIDAMGQLLSTFESISPLTTDLTEALGVVSKGMINAKIQSAVPVGPPQSAKVLTEAVKAIGDNLAKLFAASSPNAVDKAKGATFAKTAAQAAYAMLENITITTQYTSWFASQLQQLKANSELLSSVSTPTDARISEAIKVIVRICGETADACTQQAQLEENPALRQTLIDGSNVIRNLRMTLVNTTKEIAQIGVAAIQKMSAISAELQQKMALLLSSCYSASEVCFQLKDQALLIAENMSNFTKTLKIAVSTKENNLATSSFTTAQTQLTLTAESIKEFLHLISHLTPAQKQSEVALSTIQGVMEDLMSTAVSCITGQLPPPQRSFVDLRNEFSNILKEIASQLQKISGSSNINIGTSIEGLVPLITKLPTTTKQLAATRSNPAGQVELILHTKVLAEQLLAYLKLVKNIAAGSDNPQSLGPALQAVQTSLTEVVNAVSKQDLGLADVDTAMNTILAALPLIDKLTPDNVPLVKHQEALNNTSKKLVSQVSGLYKSWQTNPDLNIGESAKQLGNTVVELITGIRAGASKITNPQLGQQLLLGTREVAVSVGQCLQNAKLAAANPKDPNGKMAVENSFKGATSILSKYVGVLKEYNTLK